LVFLAINILIKTNLNIFLNWANFLKIFQIFLDKIFTTKRFKNRFYIRILNNFKMVPTKLFLTKGVGVHKNKLQSFELALRNAGIEKCNLVYVSSILPPNCKIIPKEEGIKLLKPGQITFCVMARVDSDEPNRLVSSAIGIAVPKDGTHYGYLSEHHAYGETAKKSGDYAEDLAATMLATTLGVEFNPDTAWEEREQIYKASGNIFKTTNICQSAESNKDGLWTTVLAAAVLLEDECSSNGKNNGANNGNNKAADFIPKS